MANFYHLNCGNLKSPIIGQAVCHCLLIEDRNKLFLIDTGIGLLDMRFPQKRIGKNLIDEFQIQLHEWTTAIRQITDMGFSSTQITDIVLSHADFDHAGGLADFPHANVHLSQEEYESISRQSHRYAHTQFSHRPKFITYSSNDVIWNNLPARKVYISETVQILLIPLFGHTYGHCGVAIMNNREWLLYVGDAFYLQQELFEVNHPVTKQSAAAAEDNPAREHSFNCLRKLKANLPELMMYSYHDLNTFEVYKASNNDENNHEN
jgi:glyoxylase-like metal-dependent hydrolase (beta-lactamase superfamily II)